MTRSFARFFSAVCTAFIFFCGISPVASETVVDHGHRIAEITDARLLYAGRPHGMLYGPRSPMYLKDGVPAE